MSATRPMNLIFLDFITRGKPSVTFRNRPNFYGEDRPSPDQHPRWGIASCRLYATASLIYSRPPVIPAGCLLGLTDEMVYIRHKQPRIQAYSDTAVWTRSVCPCSENKHFVHAAPDIRDNGWDFIP